MVCLHTTVYIRDVPRPSTGSASYTLIRFAMCLHYTASKNQNPDQDCHGHALLITAVIFVDITSAILPLASEYSFYLVKVRDLGLGLELCYG